MYNFVGLGSRGDTESLRNATFRFLFASLSFCRFSIVIRLRVIALLFHLAVNVFLGMSRAVISLLFSMEIDEHSMEKVVIWKGAVRYE